MDAWRTAASMIASVCWSSAVTLMVVAGMQTKQDPIFLMACAVLLSNVGITVTGWLVLSAHRAKVMDYLAHQDLRMAAAVNTALRGDRDRVTPMRP